MAYVRVLAIVLCACFIQDALSVSRVRKGPANNGAAQLATQLRSPIRQTTTVKHLVSRKAAPVQTQPTKYPNLTAVKDMFWDTWEDLNRTNVSGKLSTRSARNSVGDVLANNQFWSSLVSAIRRKVKVTNDKKKADDRIRVCNNLTSTITSPLAIQGFQEVANEVYDSVSHAQSDVSTDALELVTEMVNSGEMTRGLDAITNIVTNVKLDPVKLVKCFEVIRKTLQMGGMVNMSGGLAKGLMSLSSKLNK